VEVAPRVAIVLDAPLRREESHGTMRMGSATHAIDIRSATRAARAHGRACAVALDYE